MMRITNIPVVLWEYFIEHKSELHSLTVSNNIELLGRAMCEKVMGYTQEMAELVEFELYQWVWYHDPYTQGQIQLECRL